MESSSDSIGAESNAPESNVLEIASVNSSEEADGKTSTFGQHGRL